MNTPSDLPTNATEQRKTQLKLGAAAVLVLGVLAFVFGGNKAATQDEDFSKRDVRIGESNANDRAPEPGVDPFFVQVPNDAEKVEPEEKPDDEPQDNSLLPKGTEKTIADAGGDTAPIMKDKVVDDKTTPDHSTEPKPKPAPQADPAEPKLAVTPPVKLPKAEPYIAPKPAPQADPSDPKVAVTPPPNLPKAEPYSAPKPKPSETPSKADPVAKPKAPMVAEHSASSTPKRIPAPRPKLKLKQPSKPIPGVIAHTEAVITEAEFSPPRAVAVDPPVARATAVEPPIARATPVETPVARATAVDPPVARATAVETPDAPATPVPTPRIVMVTKKQAQTFADHSTRSYQAEGNIPPTQVFRLPKQSETKNPQIWHREDVPATPNERRPFGLVLSTPEEPSATGATTTTTNEGIPVRNLQPGESALKKTGPEKPLWKRPE